MNAPSGKLTFSYTKSGCSFIHGEGLSLSKIVFFSNNTYWKLPCLGKKTFQTKFFSRSIFDKKDYIQFFPNYPKKREGGGWKWSIFAAINTCFIWVNLKFCSFFWYDHFLGLDGELRLTDIGRSSELLYLRISGIVSGQLLPTFRFHSFRLLFLMFCQIIEYFH